MTIKELNKSKVPIIRIDPNLDRFAKMNLFQDKVDEANRIIARVGLPGDKPRKKLPVVNDPPAKYKIKQKVKRKP